MKDRPIRKATPVPKTPALARRRIGALAVGVGLGAAACGGDVTRPAPESVAEASAPFDAAPGASDGAIDQALATDTDAASVTAPDGDVDAPSIVIPLPLPIEDANAPADAQADSGRRSMPPLPPPPLPPPLPPK